MRTITLTLTRDEAEALRYAAEALQGPCPPTGWEALEKAQAALITALEPPPATPTH